MYSVVSVECGTQPPWGGVGFKSDNVKTGSGFGVFRMGGQETVRGVDQPRAFMRVDGGGSASKIVPAARADFNKHKLDAVAHHQIEFAAAAAPVARQQFETFLLE